MEERKLNEIEIDFIAYCYHNTIALHVRKEFLIHQKAFFEGVKVGLKYSELDLSPYFDSIQQREYIFPLQYLQQFVLEYVNDKNVLTLQTIQLKRKSRKKHERRNYSKKNRID